MEQAKHNTAVGNNVKRYISPKTKEVFVKTQAIICQSVTGGFGVSNNGNVERGDDDVWGENPGW